MGFKPISAEQRGVIIYLYNEGKSQRFITKKTGTSRKGVQGVLKRWIETGDAKCQPRSGRKRKSIRKQETEFKRVGQRVKGK